MWKVLKKVILLSVLPALFAGMPAEAGGKLAEYGVTLPEAPTAAEQFAARELATYLRRVTGGAIPVDSGAEQVIRLRFDASFAPEEWSICSDGGDVEIIGGRPRGVLYGAYDFLERFAGVRFFAPDCEAVPDNPGAALPDEIDIRRKPAFDLREMYDTHRWHLTAEQLDQLYLFQTRLRGKHLSENPELGFYASYGSPRGAHSIFNYIEDMVESHPEYLSLDKAGSRMISTDNVGPGQVCFSAPEVRRHFIRKLRSYIQSDRAKAKENGSPYPRYYDISVNDNSDSCSCPACVAFAEKNSGTDLAVDFINQIAAAIEAEYPDVAVSTLAYGFCVEPSGAEGIRVADNVVVRVAQLGPEVRTSDTARDTLRALSHPNNRASLTALENWAKQANQLGIWDYWVLFEDGTSPYLMVHNLAENLRTFQTLGVRTLFVETECERCYYRSFHDLRNYCAYKLMDDPSLDVELLAEDFIRNYYGPAAEPMSRYRSYLETRMTEEKEFLGKVYATGRSYLDAQFFIDTEAMLAEAETLTAGQPEFFTRVRIERQPVDYIALKKFNEFADSGYPLSKEQLAERLLDATRRFCEKYYPREADLRTSFMASEIEANLSAPPLPEQFQNKSITDFCFTSPQAGEYVSKVVEPDAAAGVAAVPELRHYTEKELHEKPITFGIYDRDRGETKFSVVVPREETPTDEKYHWYHIGRLKLGKMYFVFAHWTWQVGQRIDGARRAAAPNAWYDVYISIKVQGPAYVPGSTKENAFFVDRVIVEYLGEL